MAITPQEARKQTAPDPELIKDLERRIDEYIVIGMKERSRTVYVHPDVFNGNQHLAKNVLGRYRRAGWKITREEDEHDGYRYAFRPKTRRERYEEENPYWR
jgi:hypothetical protein